MWSICPRVDLCAPSPVSHNVPRVVEQWDGGGEEAEDDDDALEDDVGEETYLEEDPAQRVEGDLGLVLIQGVWGRTPDTMIRKPARRGGMLSQHSQNMRNGYMVCVIQHTGVTGHMYYDAWDLSNPEYNTDELTQIAREQPVPPRYVTTGVPT